MKWRDVFDIGAIWICEWRDLIKMITRLVNDLLYNPYHLSLLPSTMISVYISKVYLWITMCITLCITYQKVWITMWICV